MSRVRDHLTKREGWVASRFLSDDEPLRNAKQPEVKETVEVKPKISPSIIIQRIIAESIAGYPGRARARTARTGAAENAAAGALIPNREGIRRSALPTNVTRSMIEAYN